MSLELSDIWIYIEDIAIRSMYAELMTSVLEDDLTPQTRRQRSDDCFLWLAVLEDRDWRRFIAFNGYPQTLEARAVFQRTTHRAPLEPAQGIAEGERPELVHHDPDHAGVLRQRRKKGEEPTPPVAFGIVTVGSDCERFEVRARLQRSRKSWRILNVRRRTDSLQELSLTIRRDP